MQSHEEVYRTLEERPDLVPVLSIAPQSVASLAALHGIGAVEAMAGVRAFFRRELGFRAVFDTTFGRHLSLRESQTEYAERASVKGKERAPPLPLLASACPGWICYAEKTHGELLPFVSAVKSPQQINGTLVREWGASRQSLRCVGHRRRLD